MRTIKLLALGAAALMTLSTAMPAFADGHGYRNYGRGHNELGAIVVGAVVGVGIGVASFQNDAWIAGPYQPPVCVAFAPPNDQSGPQYGQCIQFRPGFQLFRNRFTGETRIVYR